MSHTATGEWKSFEIRMRRRRAERLVLRADVAAEAGCLEDARASLAEARALWSTAPGLAEVQEKIDRCATVVDTMASRTPSSWKEVAAAAAAVLFVSVAIALVAATTIHGRLAARDAKGIVAIVAVPEQAPVDTTPPPGTRPPIDPVPAVDSAPAADTAPSVDSTPPIDVTPVKPAPEPVRLPAAVPMSVPTRPSPPPIEPVHFEAPAPPPVIAPAAIPTSGGTVPATTVIPPTPPQDALVRSTLARYAKAYSDLDVEAAERVWPSVNRSALERAFDSLESQRVSLVDCRIQLNGGAAHASCAGTATWTPKVGGRERTDERSWEFDLEKSAGGWQITSARVQNR